MLITCHECKQQVSDTAAACPHCGKPSSYTGPRCPACGSVDCSKQSFMKQSFMAGLLGGMGFSSIIYNYKCNNCGKGF